MFNQFKNALESVAQQPIRILDAASSPEPNGENASRSSFDMQPHSASSQLAESAVSSLRKSFAPQRVNSTPDSPNPSSSTPTTRKSTLEERLRRAAQRSATGDVPSGPAASSPSSTRGRTDSTPSQTKGTSSRVTLSSPARGRPADQSKSKVSSRTASPAVASSGSKPVRSSGFGSKPSSRASSPTPASDPPSRTSPAPASRNASTTRRTASPAPTATTRTQSRPPSRTGSPTPVARTRRTSELTARAASPSPLSKHQSPLRRSSIVVNKTPSNASITLLASRDSADSKGESINTSDEEEAPLASTDDKGGEVSEKDLDPSTAVPPELSMAQSGNNEEAVTPSQEEELRTRSQATSSADERMRPNAESTTDVVVGPTVPEVIAPLEPGNLQAETMDVAEKDHSSHQETGIEEVKLVVLPDELQPKDKENVTPDSCLTPVTLEEMPSEVDLPSSDYKPIIPAPESTAAISEPTKPCTNDEPLNGISDVDHSAEIESLQARLKEVEQRFSDVSTSFKRLQAEKLTADAILKENSPLESFSNTNALRDYFANLRIKDEVFQEELKRLTDKLELQDDRLQELHEVHKVETQGLSEELRKMKTHLKETEALFEAAQRATSIVEQATDKQTEEISRLQKELEQSKNLAKEEEEKRVKAITLLKTVRQKLVKAEKDREDAMKEMATMKEREKSDKDKEQADKLTLLRELEVSHSAHGQEITSLKAQFEKDLAAIRERHEEAISTLKGQHELDLATVKTSHNKELASKSSQVSALENSLTKVTRDKNAFFEQLQLRQAELESAQSHADTIQHQNTELEFQLRETNDRLALVREEYAELQREAESRSREPTVSAEEIARMLSTTEAKHEARVAEMRRNISVLEKERHESEVDWSRKLKEKVRELEDLKSMLGSATRMRESEENMAANLKTELEASQEANRSLRREVAELTLLEGQIEELERSFKEQEHETDVKIRILEKQIDEHRSREAQLKQGNKTLREELRKVQSSAALLERQRNPGVGYWSTRGSGSGDTANGSATDSRVSISSPSPADTPSRPSSPTPSSASTTKTDEEVNLEYVRNVVLQFLEHKERRPQLVKVLSIILHFTPQETRRLIAKV